MENHETQSNPVRGAFASAEELASCASDGRSKARGAVRRFFVWTFLTAKRLLKKPSFVLILLMLPAVILLYRALITENDGKLHVAVWFEEHDELSKHFLSEMTEKVPEQFLFYECEDEEDLYSDVAAGRAECGYVFSADMAGKILTDEWRGMITAVVSERTVYGEFVNEIVYDKLNRVLSFKVVSDYLVNRSDIDGMDAQAVETLVRDGFAKQMATGPIVEYVPVDARTGEIESDSSVAEADSVLTKPIRGTVAIFVLLTGLAGLVFWYQDDAEGRFRVMARERRPLLSFASLLLPTVMAGIAGIACLIIAGLWKTTGAELAAMVLYVLFVAAFANILRFLIPSVHAVCAMIPILTLISYLCCPILLDVATVFPAIRYIRAALLPQYYLRYFEGASLLSLAVGTAVLLGISALLSVPERNR